MRTLSNAVERDRVHHAYLFVGSRGTGKTSMAKILARSLNCVDGPTLTPCGECESCVTIAAGHLARRDRDGRRLEPLGRRHPRPARAGRLRAGRGPLEGLHPRRGAHAHPRGLERLPEDARGAAAEHRLRPRDDRAAQGDADDRRPLPALRLPAPLARADRRGRSAGSPTPRRSRSTTARSARSPARPPAASATRSAPSTSSSPTAASRCSTDDVLAVLGVADAELILAAADAIAAGDGRAALEVSERLARSGRDVTQFARDLLAPPAPAARGPHARRGARLVRGHRRRARAAARPGRVALRPDAGRAVDALSKALADIREGDEPRMTVELALLRCARPQLDPSREALAERLERLEAALGGAPAGAGARGGGGRGGARLPVGPGSEAAARRSRDAGASDVRPADPAARPRSRRPGRAAGSS